MLLSRALVALALALIFSPVAFATEELPWGKNFESEDFFVGTIWCDARQTAYKVYDGTVFPPEGREFEGITISIGEKKRFYIFSPNPDSISPITFTFSRDDSGHYKETSRGERDHLLSQEAPNLYALFRRQTNDCVADGALFLKK